MINLVKGEVLSQEDKIDKAMFQEFILDMIQELKRARDKAELLDMLDHFKNRAKSRL
jgi:hypothetical protein